MASSRVFSRLSSQLRPLATHTSKRSLPSELSSVNSTSRSEAYLSARRLPRISRLPLQLSSIESMMPLHSAVASARLISSLSGESQSWGLVPQGISMPL
ncbi:hypothetical protein TorRG33x02_035410 [Trema orientale]|uniref:Protein NUCLEAR FUSION DEFECTIVE 6, chloroplastic/mitochondrial-like n=1 Tax=Trema orientale TaxID=63057 RepID=A0A2P5FT02_TREOI|nr:hypothetical protein TorRG33x02_035410 [Trema orientale]